MPGPKSTPAGKTNSGKIVVGKSAMKREQVKSGQNMAARDYANTPDRKAEREAQQQLDAEYVKTRKPKTYRAKPANEILSAFAVMGSNIR